MAVRSTKPIPSGIVRSLAEQLRREGSVWEGRGRRPVDELRPSLIHVLVQRLGLSRSVIQRALHGRSRAAPRQGTGPATQTVSRSESRSDLRPPAPKGGAHTYYRAISAAMAAAHQLPAAPIAETPKPLVAAPGLMATEPHTISKSFSGKHLKEIMGAPPNGPAMPGARDLDAIGLHAKPALGSSAPRAARGSASSSDSGSSSQGRSLFTEGRLLVEDGIDVLLTSQDLDPELKRLLHQVLDALHS